MLIFRFAIIVFLGLALSNTVWGAGIYGAAIVCKGQLILLREGSRLVFQSADSEIQINLNDVIRAGSNSRIIVKSEDNPTLVIGSHTVLQIKNWHRNGKRGQVKVLYGRMIVTGFFGMKSFNVKTENATIESKGSNYLIIVTTKGATIVFVKRRIQETTRCNLVG